MHPVRINYTYIGCSKLYSIHSFPTIKTLCCLKNGKTRRDYSC